MILLSACVSVCAFLCIRPSLSQYPPVPLCVSACASLCIRMSLSVYPPVPLCVST
jgi:hypothetical protein